MAAVGGIKGLAKLIASRARGGRGLSDASARGPSPRELANRVQSGGGSSASSPQSRPPVDEPRSLGARALLGRGG